MMLFFTSLGFIFCFSFGFGLIGFWMSIYSFFISYAILTAILNSVNKLIIMLTSNDQSDMPIQQYSPQATTNQRCRCNNTLLLHN